VNVAGVSIPIPGLDQVTQLSDLFKSIDGAMKWITTRDNWMRIGMFSGGLLLIILAIVEWDTVTSAVKQTVKG
jgi:hypothetical protein